MVHHRDRVGQLVGLLEVLGRQQEGRPLAHEVPDDLPHPEPAARIEARRRLVEDQQPRSPDERAAEVEPPPHAAGVRLHDPIRGIDEVELLEQLVGAPPCLRRGQLVEPAEQPQVLAAGQVLVHRGVLAGQADDAPDLIVLAKDVVACDPRTPGVGAEQRREDPHGRCLAGPVGPQQAEHGPLVDGQIHAVEGTDLALA